MFDRIMSWFGGSATTTKGGTGKIADMDQSRDLLGELKETGCQLMFRFRGFEGSYTSTIVAVEKNSFLIDTFIPDSGNDIAARAEDIYVETMLKGITCSFLTHFQGKVMHADNFPAFRLELPLEISRYQRRDAYRARPREETSLSFLSPLEYTGPLFDISVGGLSFEYEPALGKMRVGDQVPNMLVTLGEYTFASAGVVASNMISEVGTLSIPIRYRCGVRFDSLPDQVREDLQQYVIKIQREERKPRR